MAQLGFCEGNSGDPIFSENFGIGLVNTPLPAGTTTYNFTNGFPGDGFYTVGDGTFGNGFDWHQIEDHTTGDVNGKCLIVNASFSAGEFYRTTVSGLCETTTYEFSAWLINLVIANSFCSTQPSGTIPINVRFEIWDSTDSNLLASGDTGDIVETSAPHWEEYGLVFQTSPGQSTVILKMINNGVGGCGNDLAIDDIEFKSCGDAITIENTENSDEITLCSGETPYATTLTVTPDNSVFNSHFYQWQESVDGNNWTDILGETSETLVVSGITTTRYYRAKVAESPSNLNNADCITFSDVFELIINQAPNPPNIECWETATLNNNTCSWDITGTQPEEPTDLECWESANFNTSTCSWEVTGTQPEEPTDLECWESANFNTSTCSWEVTGTQPEEPTDLECWESASFNATTCSWEVTGTQPEEPTDLECWESSNFNTSTCSWEVTGTQPEEPTDLECWESASFNASTCSWEVTGTQPEEPTDLECWESSNFNTSTCSWEVTGTQPEEPTDLECWETTTFNENSCSWEITGIEPIDFFEENISFCEGEEVILSGNVNAQNPTYLWSTGQTTEEILVNNSGQYVVEITSSDCFTTIKTINVTAYESPVINSVTSDGSTIVITTSNDGDFEYSLDGISYQLSNTFSGIEGGFYTVYVRERNGCGVVTTTHLHFVVPKFFTPNNDGFNDTFNLRGIELFESSEVYIFNRYGKLIKSSKNQRFFWDGTFNNEKLPSSDYWYIIKIENQELRGHFTLKR